MTDIVGSTSTVLDLTPSQIIEDYRIGFRSRQVSLLGRQEVLSGRAKFGIFGDGKEVPLLALAHYFRPGDWRSGYYRDQTLMFALGITTVPQFFAQLYSHADLEADPASGGRLMNAHFATPSVNPDGSWRDLTQQYNTSADVSPTASQMPRLVGLAYASRLYRELDELRQFSQFSHNGDEVAFGVIGNASCAEGMFWEALNAIGILRAPAVITILDDDYGISVSNKHQILRQDISALLEGFRREHEGFDIYKVPGWDYPALLDVYHDAVHNAREDHIPAIVHVNELTQPQGHSTSGSHERYKSEERLNWERTYDCMRQMRLWMLREGLVSADDLEAMEEEDKRTVRDEMDAAWNNFVEAIDSDRQEVGDLIDAIAQYSEHDERLHRISHAMFNTPYPKRRDIMAAAFEALRVTRDENGLSTARAQLVEWHRQHKQDYPTLYGTHLYSETHESPLCVEAVAPIYSDNPTSVNGFQLLNQFFDTALKRDPRVIAFGEDVGFLGGVNQTMAGMQAKYGELRVSDTGIREVTIVGQAIGLAMRGLRPIAEIQYLDYLLYALQILSDDLATLRWRTVGRQKAPVIISTRGHRLEGVWHSGSPLAGIINLVRGMHVCVPRDMTRAAGFYNTLLKGDDPGIVVEVLNSYRKKERLPENLGDITIPLGVPEILREGSDVTLVTYGALCQNALTAAKSLEEVGIETEVIDVQTLLPFDIHGLILESLRKTSRIVFLDEDVPGGTTAYMMQQVLEVQGGYHWLDSEPRTLAAKAHRPAYGTDGNYFSKPNAEDIFEVIYDLMNEADPARYPMFY